MQPTVPQLTTRPVSPRQQPGTLSNIAGPMLVSPTTAIQQKRGPVRKPTGEVVAKTIRNRRYEDKKRLKRLVAAGIDPPQELLNMTPGITGRPALSDEEILGAEHASTRRWRQWRDDRAAAQRALAEAEAAGAMAQLACEAEAEAEAERLAAERLAKLRKLDRLLDARNASDGVVADGSGAIRLRAFARDDECVCAICLPCDETDESGPCEARRMRCCGAGLCAESLGEWLRRNRQQVEMGYEDGVQGVQHVRRGRKLWVRMNTHTCPVCRHPVQSTRRALV